RLRPPGEPCDAHRSDHCLDGMRRRPGLRLVEQGEKRPEHVDLGDDADQLSFLHDRNRPKFLFAHDLNRFPERCPWRDRHRATRHDLAQESGLNDALEGLLIGSRHRRRQRTFEIAVGYYADELAVFDDWDMTNPEAPLEHDGGLQRIIWC